ncbi:hypothetical protein [Kosakonia oryzae]|uniref:Uncharacterized protein n=1 Tax=Kosakonia oryzae TaxID=497725 RepID=A0AA94KQN5_9ENTR|nr:hypothetical protein [Kosakonia oryzae]ANI81765.1 hypothetical protein AWR26_06200 [Kosakonia oryzae]SFC74433.1 hypothetical protein SAMN05216286_3062 [Kosakonia oryzae]
MSGKTDLEKIFENAESLDNTTYEITLEQSLNPSFLAKCSNFSSLEELFAASGFKIETLEDFQAIPEEEWEMFITDNTTYSSWEEMQEAALAEYSADIVTAHLARGLKL